MSRLVSTLLLVGLGSCASIGHRACQDTAADQLPGRSAIAWQLNGNRTEIRGRVVDLVDQRPVTYAQVRLRRAKRFALSDSLGVVSFRDLPVGRDTLAVIAINHAPVAVPIDLPTGSGVIFVATMAVLPPRLNYATACGGANAP